MEPDCSGNRISTWELGLREHRSVGAPVRAALESALAMARQAGLTKKQQRLKAVQSRHMGSLTGIGLHTVVPSLLARAGGSVTLKPGTVEVRVKGQSGA